MEYLEERYPEPALLPADPEDRALVRLWIFRFDTNLGDAYYSLRRGTSTARSGWRTACRSSSASCPAAPGRTRSPTSPTCPGCSGPGTCSASTSREYPGDRGVARQLLERPAVAAEADVIAGAGELSLPPRRRRRLARRARSARTTCSSADVRGPNAHTRGHIAGSIPLMVGTPGQFSTSELREAFAAEAALRLRRHGVTGAERLVLYDGGDCTNAAAAMQVAELGGHPRVAVLAAGLAGWPGETEAGVVEIEKSRAELVPRPEAVVAWWEVSDGGSDALILDVRREDEFAGKGGYPCDPRQGHIPGARNVEVSTLFAASWRAEARRRGQGGRRCTRGRRRRHLLPLRLALGRWRLIALRARRLRRAQLLRLVARVVAPRRAPDRALVERGKRPVSPWAAFPLAVA